MKSLTDAALAAEYPRDCSASVSSLADAFRPRGALSPITTDNGVLATRRLMAHAVKPFAGQESARKQNQSTTRMAAAGGESGSHPEWDPV